VKLALSSPDIGKEFLLELLGPGSFFGELALLDGEPRSVDVVAVESCQL
jgi:CRP/FNR family transcriptional regulator, cyclic AMP receptor protein